MIWIAALLAVVFVGGSVLLRWGTRWGSTSGERAGEMPGDDYLDGDAPTRVVMTRAISINAPTERVWPWIAQLGRGAGWYSIDWLDNGRRTSAWHLVSWIPEPQPGDATAIGYLRYIDKDRALVWWVDGVLFAGCRARLVTCYGLGAEGNGTRLVSRMSAEATGITAPIAMLVFRAVDSIMATRQLIGIRERVESFQEDRECPQDPEVGDRDQYQLYEVLYADGGTAGVPGSEDGARWRRSAIDDGILEGGE